MDMGSRKAALCKMKDFAKKLMADGHGDSEDAGEKMMAELMDEKGNGDDEDGEVGIGIAYDSDDEDEEEDEELSELEQEALGFFSGPQNRSPLDDDKGGPTKMVFEVANRQSPRASIRSRRS